MSNEPTIDQMNEAIARFMGITPIPAGTLSISHMNRNEESVVFLNYHEDWNKLMEAWKRLIDAVAGLTEEGDYPADFSTIMDMYAYHCEKVEIGAAHNYVYQGILWYNQQTTTNG